MRSPRESSVAKEKKTSKDRALVPKLKRSEKLMETAMETEWSAKENNNENVEEAL